jgi:hypothetical protein
LNNITAGVREREDANRTREAGHLDEIQGLVANTLKFSCNGDARRVLMFTLVGFIVWLDGGRSSPKKLRQKQAEQDTDDCNYSERQRQNPTLEIGDLASPPRADNPNRSDGEVRKDYKNCVRQHATNEIARGKVCQ